MSSKVKSAKGRRAKGAGGEREAANLIKKNCPGLHAERNARNGLPTSDVLVWRPDVQPGDMVTQHQNGEVSFAKLGVDYAKRHLLEIKRVESLALGTKQMEKYRQQAEADGALGILWRLNGRPWNLEVKWGPLGWVTVSGSAVWGVLSMLVEQAEV